MFCKYCGTKNPAEANFCENCGHSLVTSRSALQRSSKAEPASQAAAKKKTAAPQPAAEQTRAKPAPTHSRVARRRLGAKSRQSIPWLLAGIILLLVGGVLIASRLMQPVSSTSTASSSTAASSATSSTSAAATWPTQTVQKVVTTNLAGLSGKSSVAVLAVDSSAKVVENNTKQRAASLIELFIMITAYQQVKAGTLNLGDTYLLQASDKVGGTGSMQSLPNGTAFSYQQVLNRMITDSDNTAANIMINKVGGIAVVNAEIKRLGLTHTVLARKLMDTSALQAGKDNYTSAGDVAKVLKKMYNHRLIDATEDAAMLDILAKNTDHTMLPHSLPSEAQVYNLTGAYTAYGVKNDAAIIKNNYGAFVVVMLGENGQASAQTKAMNQLGSSLYTTLLAKS